MTKTRMLNADRGAIVAAIIAHKFDGPEAEAMKAEHALADEARKAAYGAFIATMDAAPNGAFATTTSIKLNVVGRSIRLTFSALQRVFFDHYYGSAPALSLPDGDPFGARVLAWAEAGEARKRERRDLERKTKAAFASFYTFEAATEAWPEAASFIQARQAKAGGYIPGLPALVLSDLSAALDLPPELAESA